MININKSLGLKTTTTPSNVPQSSIIFIFLTGVLLLSCTRGFCQYHYDEYVPGNSQLQNNECIIHANDEWAITSGVNGAIIETDPIMTNEVKNEEFQ